MNQYTAVGGVTPSYDSNGNLTFDGTYNLGYDAENRLVSMGTAGSSAAYSFDGRGRRKQKAVNLVPVVSVTDADNREVLEYDGSTGALLRWYAYGLGPNDVLGQINVPAGTRLAYIPDMLGSIVATMDASTATLTPFGYRPYGSATSTPAAFAYTGQRIDPETGLYYYRARHYHPGWGRFAQSDPIGYDAGPNLYAYVQNDSLNFVDPSGACPTCLVGGLLNVAIGYGISKLIGQNYNLKSAAIDFGIGFATSGAAAFLAARRGAQIVEGVYSVTTVTGLRYVGQSADVSARLAQHVAAGKITERAAASASRYEVLGGVASREVAEQLPIDASGGIPSLANKVNPVGGRIHMLDDLALGVVTKDNLVNWGGVVASDVAADAFFSSSPALGAQGTAK